MIKELFPPILLNYLTGYFYGWKGDFSSWEVAKGKCSGYDSEHILAKVKTALLKVKNGNAVFERDSMVFNKVNYSFPLLSALLHIALQKKGKLNILDFGGSLGSSYFQNRNFLKNIQELNWCIVEQAHFVEEGLKTFKDEHLHFFYNLQSCLEKHQIDIILLASVIQYLEKPYNLLDEIIEKKIEYILIDRTPILSKGVDRITIQKVPKKIYTASYPCYELLYDSTSPERININNSSLKCFFLKRKKQN
jgi:putative methyltransferase (TIGR04325 family)